MFVGFLRSYLFLRPAFLLMAVVCVWGLLPCRVVYASSPRPGILQSSDSTMPRFLQRPRLMAKRDGAMLSPRLQRWWEGSRISTPSDLGRISQANIYFPLFEMVITPLVCVGLPALIGGVASVAFRKLQFQEMEWGITAVIFGVLTTGYSFAMLIFASSLFPILLPFLIVGIFGIVAGAFHIHWCRKMEARQRKRVSRAESFEQIQRRGLSWGSSFLQLTF